MTATIALPPNALERSTSAAILVVDDNAANLLAFEAILRPLGQPILKAKSGKEALHCLLQRDVSVILLDVQMPEMNGYELAAMLREHTRLSHVPIIFVTAINRDPSHVFSGYAQGAVDYVLKPVEPEMLRARVNVFLELHRKQQQIREQAARLHQHEVRELTRRNEARFQRLAESMPVPLWGVQADGVVSVCNGAWTALSGATATETGRLLSASWIDPLDLARAQTTWAEATRLAQPFEFECRLLPKKGGARWHLLRAVPDPGAGAVNEWIVVGVDIHDKKVAETERGQLLVREQHARTSAESANRMKDEFLATVSHELRTPLNAILGWARIMRTSPLDPKLARAIETIERNAHAQARLINDILDVSRIVVGKLRLQLEPLDLARVVADAVETVRPASDAKNVAIAWTPPGPGEEALFTGDAARVQQIVWNLLSNAVKFTPKGGSVKVTLERDGDKARLVVADTGIGIGADFLPHVFDRFRQSDATTSRAHDGLGLGLSIVKHLAELHGGSVVAESQGKGKGATFVVMLPLGLRSAEPDGGQDIFRDSLSYEATAERDSEPMRLEGATILFVDERPEARQSVRNVLMGAGATVACAETADEAVRIFQNTPPDVLISDIGLPGGDRYSLIRRVRTLGTSSGEETPAIALTAYARPEEQRRAKNEGYHVHLAKPVDPMELIMLVASLIAKRSERAPVRHESADYQQTQAG